MTPLEALSSNLNETAASPIQQKKPVEIGTNVRLIVFFFSLSLSHARLRLSVSHYYYQPTTVPKLDKGLPPLLQYFSLLRPVHLNRLTYTHKTTHSN